MSLVDLKGMREPHSAEAASRILFLNFMVNEGRGFPRREKTTTWTNRQRRVPLQMASTLRHTASNTSTQLASNGTEKYQGK